MDGDGKYAKPLEDPQVAYSRRYGKPATTSDAPRGAGHPSPTSPPSSMLTDVEMISCPKCGGRMWDNRLTKRNPKAPDYKCQNRSCDGVIWPSKTTVSASPESRDDKKQEPASVLVGTTEEELPF